MPKQQVKSPKLSALKLEGKPVEITQLPQKLNSQIADETNYLHMLSLLDMRTKEAKCAVIIKEVNNLRNHQPNAVPNMSSYWNNFSKTVQGIVRNHLYQFIKAGWICPK